MMQNVMENASTIRDILASQDGLNLWEVGAILQEPRSSALQVLRWMAARREIIYCLRDQQLYVTLARGADEGGMATAAASARSL
jgi:hypothetical protein